ncbi:MAG: carboxypeptidase-like regulatory domain-containing protein [Planctomycetota bacterium]
MKKIVLFLLIAALAAVALYFSLSTQIQDPEGPVSADTAAPVQPTGPQVAKPDDPITPATAGQPASPEVATTFQREARARELEAVLAPEKICTLTVHASLPSGTPRDNNAEVLVIGKLPDDTKIEVELAKLAPDDPLPKWLLAREPFNPEGPTEIVLEKRKGGVGVGLRGRYSYAKPLREVDISGERGDATLQVSLGAWVRGRLIPPGDASERERDLRGSELHINSDPLGSIGLRTGSDSSGAVDRDSAARADGSFEFLGVNPAKDLTLTGTPNHLAAFKTTIDELRAGQTLEVSVPLERGARLTGRVVDETGSAVGGAKLKVRTDSIMWGFGGRLLREGESDAQGAFQLEAVAAGKLTIDASKEGFLDSATDIEIAEGARVDDIVLHLSGGAIISGHVRWKDGSSCAGAKVEIAFDAASLAGAGAMNARFGAKGNGVSDEQGAFHVGGLGKGPFTVKASATPADATPADDSDASQESQEWTAQVSPVKPGSVDVELTLQPPGDVTGLVVDDLGAPVAECTVAVVGKSRSPFIAGDAKREVKLRDPEGHFSLTGLKAGSYTLQARLESGAASIAKTIEVPLAADSGPITLILARPALVSGRVVLPDGSPAGRARVQKQTTMMELVAGQAPGGGASCESDENGAFKIESLPMGSILLQASKDGYAASEGVSVKIAPAAQLSDIVLSLRTGGTITGEVYDGQGVAKSGTKILSQMPDLRYGQLWASSDSAGKFEFLHVPPGQWQVMSFGDALGASSPGAGDGSDPQADLMKNMKIAVAAVKDGETAHVVLGAPPKNPVHVRLRVTSAKTPASGVMSSFIPSQEGKSSAGLASLKMGVCDKDGRLEIDLDHAGKYLVTVQKITDRGGQQSIEFSRDIPEGADFAMEIELPLGSIAGRVLNSQGDPMNGERISLNPDGAMRAGTLTGGRFSELQTDERGEYLLDWLTPGRYSVSAGGMSFAGLGGDHTPLGRQVRDGIEISEGQRVTGIDFKLRNACQLEGKVLDAAGKPVSDASIFVRDEEGRPIDRLVMTSTNASGEFVQKGLSAGRYTVNARSAELVTAEEVSVELREDEPASIELRVAQGTLLIVTLTGDEGQEIDASFSVIDQKGRQVNGMFSLAELMKVMNEGGFDTKHQRIGPLAPGKYTIHASTSEGAKTTKSVNLIGQSEKHITLKLGD